MISKKVSYTSFLSWNLFFTSRRYVKASLVVSLCPWAACCGGLQEEQQVTGSATAGGPW
jgi:hypothetical protein